MMTLALLLSGLIFSSSLHAQTEDSEPEDLRLKRNYQRIAVVPVMADFGDMPLNTLRPVFSFPKRFDAHMIPSWVVPSGFQRDDYMEIPQIEEVPAQPEPEGKGSKLIKRVKAEINNVVPTSASNSPADTVLRPVVNEEKRIALYHQMLMDQKIGNQILAKWFDRSPEGVLTIHNTFSKRAEYNATEADRQMANMKLRGLGSLSDHADRLVNRTYVIVGDMSHLVNKADSYNASNTKAEDRTEEGYTAGGTAMVFQLDFGDSIQSIFWNDLWVDETDDPAKIQARKEAFDNMNFPFVFVNSFPIGGSALQSIPGSKRDQLEQTAGLIEGTLRQGKPGVVAATVGTRRTMPQLREACIQSFASGLPNNVHTYSCEFIDCTIRTNLTSVSPPAGFIGSREGLGRHHTYFLMEDIKRRNGSYFSKKVGAVRVLHVGQNDSTTKVSSTFYQIAGAKPYKGMFLSEKKEAGINLGVGFERGLKGGMTGPTARAEISLSRILPMMSEKPHSLWVYGTATVDGGAGTRQDFTSSQTYFARDQYAYRTTAGPNKVLFFRWTAGLMYERYFWRNFHYNLNLGYGRESSTDLDGLLVDHLSPNQAMVDAGAKLGVSLTHSLQLEAGVVARMAIDSPYITENDPDDDEKPIRVPIESASYGDIFPGRGLTVSAVVGFKFLL